MNFQKISLGAALVFLAACNLTKDVEVVLPAYESQPVVECYLEPGQPMTLLLTKSSPYFEPLGQASDWLGKLFLDSALVTIAYPAHTDTLKNQLFFNLTTGKIYNYHSPTIVEPIWGIEYKLEIRLKNGQTISAKTNVIQPVKIDSVVVEWNPERDTLARTIMYTTDDPGATNYYRRQLHEHSLDSTAIIDFALDDRLFVGNRVAYGGSYEFTEGDTVFNTIFHIEKPYYDYLNSVQTSIQANFNPFAQPSLIHSNLSGSANAIGIFTGLSYDRVRTIIHR